MVLSAFLAVLRYKTLKLDFKKKYFFKIVKLRHAFLFLGNKSTSDFTEKKM